MIRSFRNRDLKQMWEASKPLPHKTLIAEGVLDILDSIDAAVSPGDPAFKGFRFDEWLENEEQRYGVMLTNHWLISYGWSEGHAVSVDLERIE